DNHLLVVDKPPGLATMGVAPEKPSLLSAAKAYIKQKYQKPGNVYLGIVSRLDAPVTGLLVLARTSKAAARLTEQFRNKLVRKSYRALIQTPLNPPQATLRNWLRKDERHRRMHIVSAETPGAREAILSYQTLQTSRGSTLLEVDLKTGRKHQIRLQLSEQGSPILGDRKYGSRVRFPAGIALHAHALSFQHPVQDQPLQFTAPLPAAWKSYGY
ncbi:MAG TPA: RluA family pseudouridine synthase, partial [Planctomycetaceae bacterium]|nr:RluA family pseudouridine synthase [Planctomycetaceae bacterium]